MAQSVWPEGILDHKLRGRNSATNMNRLSTECKSDVLKFKRKRTIRDKLQVLHIQSGYRKYVCKGAGGFPKISNGICSHFFI